MKKIILLGATLVLTAGISLSSHASDRHEFRDRARSAYSHDHRGGHEATHRINHRQQNLRKRIHWGIRQGRLSSEEIHRLRHQQRKIARLEDHFLEDGRLSRREQGILERRLDQASDTLYRLKHNRQTAWNERDRRWEQYYDDHRDFRHGFARFSRF